MGERYFGMPLSREARVKAGFGHLYPEARSGAWEPASGVARRVADRVLARQGYAALLQEDVAPDDPGHEVPPQLPPEPTVPETVVGLDDDDLSFADLDPFGDAVERKRAVNE